MVWQQIGDVVRRFQPRLPVLPRSRQGRIDSADASRVPAGRPGVIEYPGVSNMRRLAAIFGVLLLTAPVHGRPHMRSEPAAKRATVDSPAASAGSAAAMHLVGIGESEASLVIDLPHGLAMEPTLLSDPRRLVLDMPKLALPSTDALGPDSGPVASWRFGRLTADRSRIVLDLRTPAEVVRIDALPTAAGVRMVATIRSVSPERFDMAMREQAAARFTGAIRGQATAEVQRASAGQGSSSSDPSAAEAAVSPAQVAAATPEPTAVPPQAAPAAVMPVQDAPAATMPLVIIDPGHGGVDTGAVGSAGDMEKTLVLEIGQTLKRKLEAGGKVRVEMTRELDVFVALPERVRLARAHSAALFLSIHADILYGEPNVRGATVYTLSDKASDASAAKLAEKENRADLAAGIESADDAENVSGILFDLARRETRQFSQSFARTLINGIHGPTQINKNPHRSAGFRVLKAPDVPSVLLELGYLSSAEDVRLLKSPEWQDKVTGAAAMAIERFVSERGQDGRTERR